MKIIKRLLSFGTAIVLSLSSLLVFAPAISHATQQTCVWNGGGSDAKFSTAANWSSCGSAAPLAGDVLSFPALGTAQAPINDTTLTYATIQFSGTSGTCSTAPFVWYNFTGTQTLSIGGVASTVIDSMTGNCPGVLFNLNVAFTTDATVNSTGSIMFGVEDTTKTLSIGSHTVTAVGNTLYIYSKISGSGAINNSTSGILDADNSGYSGIFTQNSKSLTLLNYAGSTLGTGSAVINDTANLAVYICDDGTFSNGLTLNGASSDPTGDFPIAKLTVSNLTCPRPAGGGAGGGGGCTGTCPTYDEYYSAGAFITSGAAVTLSSPITQGTDSTITTYTKTATLTGAITGGKAINLTPGGGGTVVINSSSNGSTTANGTYVPAPVKKTLSDSLPTTTVDVTGNYELTIDGARGATTIETGAVLKGTGTVGALTIMTGGKVAPGHSPGCLSTGNLTLNGALDEELGGTTACTGYDQLKVTGTVDVTNGTLNVSLYNGFKPALGQKYTIIDNDGSDAVTGTFTGVAEGGTVTSGKYSFKVSYKGGTGNDVVLSVIGTPDTGFELISSHPLATFLTMTFLAAGIALAGRRYSKLLNR